MTLDTERIPLLPAIQAYFGYGVMMLLGIIRDLFSRIFKPSRKPEDGYPPMVEDFTDFFARRMYRRIEDGFNRPVYSAAGSWIDVMERDAKCKPTGKLIHCLNLGSYNYLGFGDPDSPCRPSVFASVDQYSAATGSFRGALGTTSVHVELEKAVARFVGKEAAMVFGMGFGTNATAIPALIGKGGLILSDANNHASIVAGARSSGARIKAFKHNNVKHLEKCIRSAIVNGQDRTHRPYTKILIICEGIYSMEGEMCPLKEIVAVKKKYGCYLFVDEAHSIGAIGPHGRGICDEKGVDPTDVDVLMGTFTKSFGSVGGYIAGSKELVAYMQTVCASYRYSPNLSPPSAQQVLSAMRIIMGEDGTDLGQRKLRALRENSDYVRNRLKKMGVNVLGESGSPVCPVLFYLPGLTSAFGRLTLERGIAFVIVGFPATPLLLSRTRICLSAAHTKEDLAAAMDTFEELSKVLGFDYKNRLLTRYI